MTRCPHVFVPGGFPGLWRGCTWSLLLVLAVGALPVMSAEMTAQTQPPDQADPLGPPTERGIRWTPEMARLLADKLARHFAEGYELDNSKVEKASEVIARRLMAAIHANGEPVQATLEMVLTEMAEKAARRWEPGYTVRDTIMTPKFCQRLAEHGLPLVPAVRRLCSDIARDIRPMLVLEQQAKLGADLTISTEALTVLEQKMQRWADGLARTGENPLAGDHSDERDESGRSKTLQDARYAAEAELDKKDRIAMFWGHYLARTEQFYGLDQRQRAAADLVLEEYLEGLERLLNDSEWRTGMYQARLWLDMAPVVLPWDSPLRDMPDRQYAKYNQQLDDLGDEFRLRLDKIPTESQRAEAAARVAESLESQGYDDNTVTEAN